MMINFVGYLRQAMFYGFTSSAALALVAGLFVVFQGEITGNIKLTLELTALDGLWIMLGIPVVLVMLYFLFSPISYLLHVAINRATGKTPE